MFKCNFILVTFFTHAFSRLFKCEQCDREETQKHLLSTHKRVGTKFKCNRCDRIACQWCSLKSHKKRKYIKYQCDHCHYKPSKNQLKNNDRNIKGQINIRSHLPKPHHITHFQSWSVLTQVLVTFPDPEWYSLFLNHSVSTFMCTIQLLLNPLRLKDGNEVQLDYCACVTVQQAPLMIILNPKSPDSYLLNVHRPSSTLA